MNQDKQQQQQEQEQEEEQPRDSSAARCIVLRHLGQDFAVEYTHQCFEEERIRGYRPMMDDGAVPLIHSSFRHETNVQKELRVMVTLSPSCESCTVHVEARDVLETKKRKANAEAVSSGPTSTTATSVAAPQKRVRFVVADNVDTDTNKVDGDNVTELNSRTTTVTTTTTTTTTTPVDEADMEDTSPLSRNEILSRLQRALPPIVDEADKKDNASLSLPTPSSVPTTIPTNAFISKPIGTIVETYSVASKDAAGKKKQQEFCVTLATAEEASVYHNKVQRLALFYIESAENVSLIDANQDGYWKVLYLFQKHKKDASSNEPDKSETPTATTTGPTAASLSPPSFSLVG